MTSIWRSLGIASQARLKRLNFRSLFRSSPPESTAEIPDSNSGGFLAFLEALRFTCGNHRGAVAPPKVPIRIHSMMFLVSATKHAHFNAAQVTPLGTLRALRSYPNAHLRVLPIPFDNASMTVHSVRCCESDQSSRPKRIAK